MIHHAEKKRRNKKFQRQTTEEESRFDQLKLGNLSQLKLHSLLTWNGLGLNVDGEKNVASFLTVKTLKRFRRR